MVVLISLLPWIAGGLITGLVGRWENRALTWPGILLITAGWGCGGLAGAFAFMAVGNAVPGPVCGLAWAVTAGLIGGAVTLWQWNRVDDQVHL